MNFEKIIFNNLDCAAFIVFGLKLRAVFGVLTNINSLALSPLSEPNPTWRKCLSYQIWIYGVLWFRWNPPGNGKPTPRRLSRRRPRVSRQVSVAQIRSISSRLFTILLWYIMFFYLCNGLQIRHQVEQCDSRWRQTFAHVSKIKMNTFFYYNQKSKFCSLLINGILI